MKKLFTLFFLVLTIGAFSQESKFGDVSVAALQETSDADFPEANAKVIYRKVDYEFGKVLYVYERIKIYNKEGFEYAKWEINFDDVESLKAYTYNLEGGEVVKTKVGKESIFKEDIGDGEEISKISFPNVKEGSILELKYKVRDLGLRAVNTQAYVPIKRILITLTNPYSREVKVTENLLSNVRMKVIDKPFEIRYSGNNIKPFIAEKYMSSNYAFLGKLFIEQVAVRGIDKLKNWGDVAKLYNETTWFGLQLNKTRFFKKDVAILLGDETDPLKKAKKIYYYLQDRMTWNNYYSRGSENVRAAYEDKIGAVGEINLTLTSMLRREGLNANPFLVATKSRGYVLFPTATGFNSTISALELDGKTYLLDASNKDAAFGEIRNTFNNGKGLIVYEDHTFKTFDTSPTKMSKGMYLVNATIDPENLSVSGEVKRRVDGYLAFDHRNQYKEANENAYFENLRDSNNQLYTANTLVKDIEDIAKPVTISYSFNYEDSVEEIGDNLYVSPLLHFGTMENEFDEEERVYPIDFKFPFTNTYTINFKLPEGYEIESVPDPLNVAVAENIGSVVFNNTTIGDQLQLSFKFQMNHALIAADYYEAIRGLFTEYFKLSQSKIVLTKK